MPFAGNDMIATTIPDRFGSKKFLCLVIDRTTKATLKEYEIDAVGFVSARHQAAYLYATEVGSYDGDWYVDSLEL
jgi:hypothetical protein